MIASTRNSRWRGRRSGASQAATSTVLPPALPPMTEGPTATTAVGASISASPLQRQPSNDSPLGCHCQPSPAQTSQSLLPPLPSPPAFMPAVTVPGGNTTDLEARQLQWKTLVTKFRVDRLHQYSWEWVGGEFLPIYTFQTVSHITKIWDEYANGLNGYLAVRDLGEHWQA